jgi:predicted acetyltransferase
MARANLRLERVSNARLESFVAMRDAFLAAGEDEWTGGAVIAHENPSAYIETLRGWREGINVPPNWGPAEAFFIMEGDVVVGQCDVRYPITPSLEQYGGHIGYHVHPQHRGHGIATFALREALEILAAKGGSEALLTCSDTNHASIRVIENCGGRRISDSTRRRYAISLAYATKRE